MLGQKLNGESVLFNTGPPGPLGSNGGGLTYTRWGRTSCPSTAQSVYQGTTVGSAFYESGSSDYLCLHTQPQYIRTTGGQQTWRGKLYATEYDTFDSVPTFFQMFRHDVPCIVCYTARRSARIMIPGRISCPSSWTREYYGYLMGIDHHQPRGSRSPICVDVNAESVPGSIVPHIKSVLNFYETTCLGIDCPPYFDGAETTCVVCTK